MDEKQIQGRLAGVRLPAWDLLPDFGLYMDQLVTYVQRCLAGLDGTDAINITPAMISRNGAIFGINAVGRNHAGGNAQVKGVANFSFVDGHVERMDVLKSVQKRLWGERFYSLSGQNKVDPTMRMGP